MARDDGRNLGGVHKHASHFGGLIRPAHPSLDPRTGSAAGTDTFQGCRKIPRGKTDERVTGFERRHQHFTDFAGFHRISRSRADNLQQNFFIEKQSFPTL